MFTPRLIAFFNRRPTPALLALLLASCDAKEEPEDFDNEAGGGSCIDTPTVISVDEVSALGFAAADVLAVASGEHTSPIFWESGLHDGPIDVEFGPETGEGVLTIALSHEGGEVRFVDSEPNPEEGFGEGDLEGIDCPDRLEIDVVAEVETAGGALAETLPVTLWATNDLLARFSAELDLEALTGSFAVENGNPEMTLGPALLDVGVSTFGLAGSLTGTVEMSFGDIAGVGFIEYASFPTANPTCSSGELSIPLDAALQGFSAADALALVNRPWIFEFAWEGGEATTLELAMTHDGREVCAQVESFEGGAGTLRFGAVVDLLTGDGTVMASFSVLLSAEPDENGDLGQVHVWNDAPYGALVPVADFAEAFGQFGIDLAGYELAGVEFSGAFVPNDAPGSADGSLAVLGGIGAECSDEPGEPCEGIDVDELAFGTWGNTGVGP